MSPRRTMTLALLCGLAACAPKKSTERPKVGQRLAEGATRNLKASPDGTALAYLAGVAPPQEPNVPEGIVQGVLMTLVPGKAPRPLGSGVASFDDGFRIAPDGRHLAYLAAYRFREGEGRLELASMAEGEPQPLAERAAYYQFSRDGKLLGYVAAGAMHLYDLDARREVFTTAPAASFELSRDARWLLVRRPVASGGELALARVGAKDAPRRLGGWAGEYAFSPDGARLAFTSRPRGPADPYRISFGPIGGALRTLGAGATTFSFSPDGAHLAFIDGQGREKTYGDLVLVAAAGGAPKKVGEDVVEHRWSPSSSSLALRESHELKGRIWTTLKVVTVPSGALRLKDEWTPNDKIDRIPLLYGHDGAHLAYQKHVLKPMPSVNLMLVPIAGEGPAREIGRWVFGYQFEPSNQELWFLTNCVRNGRECELTAASLTDPAKPPQKITDGIWSFKPAATGDRILLTYPRSDTLSAGDLGWITRGGVSKGIDSHVLNAAFLDAAGTRVGYLVNQRKREGVYVAELE